ncbi:capsular biosynthesis protein, partial [Pontibacter sp. HJ8]
MVNNKSNTEDNIGASIVFKFLPFWPLFAVLLVVCMLGAWGYLHFLAVPSYGVSASVIVKDEKKGVNDSKMTESIDAFTTNKIVENEINVLRSHALMKQVVDELGLYVSVYEEDNRFRSIPAYTTSPITITLESPAEAKEQPAIYFTYNDSQKKVEIDYEAYPLDKWVKTPYGVMRFSENKKRTDSTEAPLFFSISNPKKVANQLLNGISIETPGKLSSVVNLYLEDQVPERGEDILNALIHAYQQTAITDRNKLATETLEFVESRIRLIEKELAELENKIVQYRASNGAVNLDAQGRMFLQNVGDNDRKMSEINLQLAVLDKVEKYVVSKSKAAGIVPSTLGVNDPVLTQLLQKLYTTEIQYQQLSKTTAENNPILVSLREEIGSIRPSILENIRNQRDNLLASRANIASTNNAYNSLLQTIPNKERELLEISRQQTIKNEAYSFLLQKREETVLSYAPTAEDLRIVDMAEASRNPISPKPIYAYMSAVFLSLGVGIGLVLGKEMLNSKVLFRSEIEAYTNAPIVAELSSVQNLKKGVFVEPTEPSEIEQFRQLRVTMGLYGRTFTKKKIMVTSSIPGEGKSYVSTNVAFSLATSGKKVVLLDFDLRNPNTSVLFDSYKAKGII